MKTFYRISPILFSLFLLIQFNSIKAQKIFSCSSKYEADIKVFVTESNYDADLLVYKVKSKYDAEGNKGLWFFTESKYDADKQVFFTESKYDADLLIYFVESKYEADWRDRSKIHLLYLNPNILKSEFYYIYLDKR
jgi:hypothetical protein